MLIPDLSSLQLKDDSNLLYRGEGNSSLVIALSHTREVIRLLKSESKTNQKQLKFTKESETHLYSLLRQHVMFNETTIVAILPKELFVIPKIVKLSEQQIKTIKDLIRDKRPKFRENKTILQSTKETFALLLPDYCCLQTTLQNNNSFITSSSSSPVIGVEIKPKQGFLPEERVLSLRTELKSRVCRYGLSQFHKLNKKSINSLSDYCPLDLFSGCETRQMTALRSLIDCPQNNFRVFRDLNYVFGDETNNSLEDIISDFVLTEDPIQGFCRLLLSALSMKVFASEEYSFQKNCEEFSCSLHNNASHRCSCESTQVHNLSEGSVLEAILCAQRLDSIDSYLANEMLETIHSIDNNNNVSLLETIPKHFKSKERDSNETQKEFFIRKVWQFLVSLTAKDCSIMIAMQRIDSKESLIEEIEEKNKQLIRLGKDLYHVRVRVTDLDQKSEQKISRTLSNDNRMISAYLEHQRHQREQQFNNN